MVTGDRLKNGFGFSSMGLLKINKISEPDRQKIRISLTQIITKKII